MSHQHSKSNEEIVADICERYLEMLVHKKTKNPVTHHWLENVLTNVLAAKDADNEYEQIKHIRCNCTTPATISHEKEVLSTPKE